ncbi:S41 family peptidase [Aquimarina brevivitae]|nr:S41 family peptidase [Aquimarina brevivitae]
MRKTLLFTLLFTISLVWVSCFSDNDDSPSFATSLEIKDYIWKGMNAFYLYKGLVPDLANDRFNSNQEYTDYLNGFTSPETIFEDIVTDDIDAASGLPVDDFSFLVDNYIALEQALDGITLNNGMEFGLVRYPEPNQSLVFGFVRYVLPGTDAETKGIQRGDIFNTIDGIQIDDQNFRSLIDRESYTIGLATFDGNTVTPTGESIPLTKVQYTENPVYIAKTLDIGGNPVGYLMYNGFTGDFDTQLNQAFGQFQSAGVTDLILDLRYNGGGSVTTAIDLSSMITGQFNGQVFSTEQWNEDRQAQFGDTNLFDNTIRTGAAINSLNLSRLFVLTTRSSASASELVINGLDPYIEVIQIGTATRGKFQASITLYDSNNFGRQGANPGHTYAIQPLVLKSANSVGYTDYYEGFIPDIELAEDYANAGTLGELNEPLLQTAADYILGNRIAPLQDFNILENLGDSNMINPDYERMYTKFDPKKMK